MPGKGPKNPGWAEIARQLCGTAYEVWELKGVQKWSIQLKARTTSGLAKKSSAEQSIPQGRCCLGSKVTDFRDYPSWGLGWVGMKCS